ncbi:triacylglycerol lipase [Geosmithia morbida]|uniref:GPI inositol-deacylase n=1 Tax=Geosmithia morbida TaxID=1094350 RepID=A0A9P4YSV3_9HYPO|nr:triacylglycerol lipase [Geosmithia morbida]KAF4121031.1 triacylglycerol lipase [Geosmithia morbida]
MNTRPIGSRMRTLRHCARQQRQLTTSRQRLGSKEDGEADAHDVRMRHLGRRISDDYAKVRDTYDTPKNIVVLAHGLLGFSELRVSRFLPAVQYWRGIKEALEARGARVICTTVPATSSIVERAERLRDEIDEAVGSSDDVNNDCNRDNRDGDNGNDNGNNNGNGSNDRLPKINVIAHSMGGLDARYMVSQSPPVRARVASLVTVSTPHRGSYIADMVQEAGWLTSAAMLSALVGAGLGSGQAFAQLTRRYVQGTFNPGTPDVPGVEYMSYGAEMTELSRASAAERHLPLGGGNPFRVAWRYMMEVEGANDGLVSVESARWREYLGTLVGVSHIDLINWSNRARWAAAESLGLGLTPRMAKTFNAVAFYLDVADMLAKRGL